MSATLSLTAWTASTFAKGYYDTADERVKPRLRPPQKQEDEWQPVHIVAAADTLEALLEAIHAEEERLEADRLLTEAD